MSQFAWTYFDDFGHQHYVGLFHGDDSGHLVVYCDADIIVIDFNVLTSKKYSFFIEEELCDVNIEEKEGKFSYDFSIDQEADTPRNRGRKAMQVEETKESWLVAAGFCVVVVLAVFLIWQL